MWGRERRQKAATEDRGLFIKYGKCITVCKKIMGALSEKAMTRGRNRPPSKLSKLVLFPGEVIQL